MAVFRKCRSCGSLYSLDRGECPGCGVKPAHGDAFKVDVKTKGRRITKVVPTLREARKLEEAIRATLAAEDVLGVPLVREKQEVPRFSEFFEKVYLPEKKRTIKNENDFKNVIGGYYRKWLKPVLGDKPLDKIDKGDVAKVVEALTSAGKAPRTVEHVLAILRNTLNVALDAGLIAKNPASKFKLPRYDNKRTRFLTREEAEKLLAEARRRTTPRNWIYPIVLMALTTGMRAGEIFKLTWQDVDFENEIVHVRDPKSGKDRVAYMTPRLKEALLEHKGKVDSRPHAPVFPGKSGQPMKQVPDVFKNIVKDLGFNEGVTDPRQKVCFHTLRHTFCSWLAIEGTPLHVIKELAGHSSIQVTERYAHLLPDVRRRAVKVIEKMLEQGSQG